MTNTQSHAKRELEILFKITPDAIIREFEPEILALCEKFGQSGQSGGSAPFTAGALADAIKKLCLQKTIAPLTGEEDEWGTVADEINQNNRDSAVFKSEGQQAYYLNAIVWSGDTPGESGNNWDTFTGSIEGITSRQRIKEFPFTPKTFYVDVTRVPYDEKIHKSSEAVSCGPGDFVYFIKNREQLKEVFEYYDLYQDTLKM